MNTYLVRISSVYALASLVGDIIRTLKETTIGKLIIS